MRLGAAMRYLCLMTQHPVGSAGPRYERLDALRGLAIAWMAAFHFGFDLNHFGLIARQNFHADTLWTTQRSAILSLFLFCAGVGQAIAIAKGQDERRFWRRWAQIAGCALLVSAGSAVMFPRSMISFGVLHGIALMLIVTRYSAGWGRWLWVAGAVALLLPRVAADPVFDGPWLAWTGLVSRKPITEDYVPLLPWLALMWWGQAAGQWLLAERPGLLGGRLPQALAPLAAVGRWPLTIYMLHQPLLIGAIWLYLQARG